MTSQPAGGTQPAAPDTAAPANQAPAHPAPVHHVVRRTRIGGIWVAAALFAVVLLLIFILETARACPSAPSAHTAICRSVSSSCSPSASACYWS